MIVDMENHYDTEKQLRSRGYETEGTKRGYDGGTFRASLDLARSRIDDRLRFMDEAGIDMAALTSNWADNLEEVRDWNNSCATIVREHPDRFVGIASCLPMGGEPALEEMQRAVKELGMRGIHIDARPQGQELDSRELWPFYEKASELAVPIDVHVYFPENLGFLEAPYPLEYYIGRELYQIAATLRLCLGGVLEEFPDLVFIMNHFGGGISAIKERVDTYIGYLGDNLSSMYHGTPLISKPWTEYFDKLYFSMAGRGIARSTVRCALANISPRRLMFGTDWPPNFQDDPQGAREYIAEIRKLDLPEEDIDAMLGGNAARLLGIVQN